MKKVPPPPQKNILWLNPSGASSIYIWNVCGLKRGGIFRANDAERKTIETTETNDAAEMD